MTYKIGDKQCSGSNLETWNGSKWEAQYCAGGCKNNACKPKPSPSPTSTTSPESAEWHYKCSQGGDFALYIHNQSLGIDWNKSQRCKKGCENGSCIGGLNNDCQEGQISLDKFEKCVSNNWQCIPGQTRTLTLPGQSNIPHVIGCDQNNNTYVISDLSDFQKLLSCDKKNNLINSAKEIISSCANDETCLNAGSYNFISYAGCYRKDFIDANTCREGDIKEPLPGECKLVCKKKEWVYVNPLECLRDPTAYKQRTCSHDEKANVLENGKIVEICPNGCSYGQCIPKRLASCNNGDGYLAGYPACLVACVNGYYQSTQICADTIELTGTWNNQDLLLLLMVINEFPETLTGTIGNVTFDRLDQPYAYCANNCTSVANGYYSPPNNLIGIPDTGANNYTLGHEIMHALHVANPQLLDDYIGATGCQQNPTDPNGNYLFSETPYREYGETNCTEGLAVSCGEEYMDPLLSCGMRTARPNAYNFCKDSVFNDTEFCQSNAKGSIIKKLMKQTAASFFTVVYAAETLETTLGALIPGTTNIKGLESTMGLPLETIQQFDKTIFTYASTDKSRPHLVYVKDGIVTFVQIVPEKNYKLTLTDIVNRYGAFEDKSYSTHGHNTLVYSYPSQGISFHLDGNTEQAFMIQKYIPSTKEEFKETVGKNFKNEPLGDSFQEVALIKEQLTAKPENQAVVATTNNMPIILIFSTIAFISIAAIIFRHKVKNR